MNSKPILIIGLVFLVGLTYLLLLGNMELVVSTANVSANTIETSPNASTYVTTTAILRYWPMAVILLPAVFGVVMLVKILKGNN